LFKNGFIFWIDYQLFIHFIGYLAILTNYTEGIYVYFPRIIPTMIIFICSSQKKTAPVDVKIAPRTAWIYL